MYRLVYIQENELDFFQIINQRSVTISKVYDGDTITTNNGEKIRIIGIDTPEKGEEYDDQATEMVKDLVLNQKVNIKICENPRDRYGRTLASIFTKNGKNIAAELLKAGFAKAYYLKPCGSDTKDFFAQLEKDAQEKEIGIWSLNENAEDEKVAAETSEAKNENEIYHNGEV